MRRLALAGLLGLLGCQAPEAAYLEWPGSQKVFLAFEDATPASAAGLGPQGVAAYREALEARLGPHLTSSSAEAPTLQIVVSGLREAVYEDPRMERLASAALTRNPVLIALSLVDLDGKTRAKLESLGYPIRVPEAGFALRVPRPGSQPALRPLPASAVILAHPKLMHGERGPEERLKAEASAFAAAVERELQRVYGWPRRS
jgi:hypothetical protein